MPLADRVFRAGFCWLVINAFSARPATWIMLVRARTIAKFRV